jgi:hypothetical protein
MSQRSFTSETDAFRFKNNFLTTAEVYHAK